MKKFFKIAGLVFLIIIAGISFRGFSNMKDRHRGYSADMKILNSPEAALKAGFAAVAITPEVPDRWVDVNGDSKYKLGDGVILSMETATESLIRFGSQDSVITNRQTECTMTFGQEQWLLMTAKHAIAIVILDVIGFMHDDVVDVRKMLPDELGLTYTIIASTHTHEGSPI